MYRAPVEEQLFVLNCVACIPELQTASSFEHATGDVVRSILVEAAKLAEEEFAPANREGDIHRAVLVDGRVRLPERYKAAFDHYVKGGWPGISSPAEIGGHGLPLCVAQAVNEQLSAANASLTGCAQLTWGAIDTLMHHGDDEQKERYLGPLVSGAWAGTMNLTEPHAGTDVGALRTSAKRQADGSYRIKGQKIFISFGEHELTSNIIHLVLARTEGSPAGSKGLSLFIVPKFLQGPDGSFTEGNDITCLSLEHKLGQNGSPTCTMIYGDRDGCVGFLLGEEMGGMKAMFTMMNHARVNVGVQGVALADRAYQEALEYAKSRVQSKPLEGGDGSVEIIQHPDVQRMLLTQRAQVEGIRALVYFTAGAIDRATAQKATENGAEAQLLADLLTPIAKSYATDIAVQVTSDAIQVFGGLGFIEETGVAQHYRDVRILPIYEGTNGIQALDLVNRKIGRDGGETCLSLFSSLRRELQEIGNLHARLKRLDEALVPAFEVVEEMTRWMAQHTRTRDAAAGASPYLRLLGATLCAALLARQAANAVVELERGAGNSRFLEGKITTAIFYAEQLLPPAISLASSISAGAELLSEYSAQMTQ